MNKTQASGSVLNKLKTASDCQRRLDELRALSSRPTVLYGAGIYAREVQDFLSSLGVPVAGCFVDDAYVGQAQSGGLKPSSFSDIDSAHAEYNVVVAFCGDPSRSMSLVKEKNSSKIRSIQIIDCRFWRRFQKLKRTWIETQRESFDAVYGWLGDDISKETFVAFINAKLSYDPASLGSFTSFPQYFPGDLPAFQPGPEDVFVDAGAYNGDTLAQVVSLTGARGTAAYYAFEPDERNLSRLCRCIQDNGWRFVHVVPTGLWSTPGRVRFHDYHDSRSFVSKKGEIEIDVDTLDSLSSAATFIKMDIEGSEFEALKGAEKTITAHAPKIAVAVYHNPEDIIRIPQLLKRFFPNYKFYLRLHSLFSEELVLYAEAAGEKPC